MNKKIFATALFAVAAFVSTGASAANTYSNTVNVAPNAQTDNAVVGLGGTSRANDLRITVGGVVGDMPADSEIIIRLPAGLNFSGNPVYSVGPVLADQGLTLKDNTIYGDPTLGSDTSGVPNVGLQLFDTDADGGMDRALIETRAVGAAGDTLTISVNVAANADATLGTKKAAIIVAGGLAVSVDLVEVISQSVTGVVSSTGTSLVTVDQQAYGTLGVLTPTFAVVIPKGAKNGDTVTITPAGKVVWNTTSTVTVTDVLTPINGSPLSQTVGVTTTTGTVTFVVKNAPATGLANDVVADLQVDVAGIGSGSAIGNYGFTVGGTAMVAGNANVFAVKANASSAALVPGAALTSIVSGSSSPQALPALVITENFDGDAAGGVGGSNTITITAGAGLTFGTATPTITSGATVASTALTSSMTVWTFTLTSNDPTTTITISGLTGTAASSATGNLSVAFGGSKTASNATNTVAVATAKPVGTVTVTGPATLSKIGPKATNTASFKLEETTYSAITKANFVGGSIITNQSYFRVTASSNASVTNLTATVTYAGANGPVFSGCQVEAPLAKTWVCILSTESTSLTAGDSVTVTATYTADAMVGDTVSLTLDGNTGIAGSADVATIVEASEAKVSGRIKLLKEGLTTAQAVSTFTISEKFSGAVKAGQFRVIAPAGVVFATPYPASSAGTGTVSVDTFAPNDTLVIYTAGTGPTTPSITVSANVIVASSKTGYIAFDIVDGDLDAAFKTGLTEDSVTVAYADKDLPALDAGPAISLNVGFTSPSVDITGGLVGDGYEVKSSNTGTITVTQTGASYTVTGVAAGAANVEVTDELGTKLVAVTVSAGATQPPTEKGPNAGSLNGRTGVSFTMGATSDGGSSYGTTFSATDDVTIVATVNVDTTDLGEAGGIHVAQKTGATFNYLDEDGNFVTWDTSGVPGAHIVTDELVASYSVTVVSNANLPVGTHRFALAYSVGNEVIYTGKAIVITVTE